MLQSSQMAGRYYNLDLDVILNITARDGGLAISNFRTIDPLPLTYVDANIYHVGWGNAAYTEGYTIVFGGA